MLSVVFLNIGGTGIGFFIGIDYGCCMVVIQILTFISIPKNIGKGKEEGGGLGLGVELRGGRGN